MSNFSLSDALGYSLLGQSRHLLYHGSLRLHPLSELTLSLSRVISDRILVLVEQHLYFV